MDSINKKNSEKQCLRLLNIKKIFWTKKDLLKSAKTKLHLSTNSWAWSLLCLIIYLSNYVSIICISAFLWPFYYFRNTSRSIILQGGFRTVLLFFWRLMPSISPDLLQFFSEASSNHFLLSVCSAPLFADISIKAGKGKGTWLILRSLISPCHLSLSFWSKVFPYQRAFNSPFPKSLPFWRRFCTLNTLRRFNLRLGL